MKFITKYLSPCFNYRKKGSNIKYIILHYTAMNSDIEAIHHLSQKKNKVSTHFLIGNKGQIINMVNLEKRAWHAGLSFWRGIKDINSYSIGIELDNLGNNKYTIQQIKSLIKLIKYLKNKYNIKSINILGHSEIAPYRKKDPGSKFPWKKLAKLKLVFISKKISVKKYLIIENYLKKQDLKNAKMKTLFMLSKIGYDISKAKKNKKNFSLLIKVYEMRYRPNNITGKLDSENYKLIVSHFNMVIKH